MKVGEPILENPNSYVSIKRILAELKKRQWVFLGCDGPPYCLANRIIDESDSEYDWVSLIPGLGHLHINKIKTLFKVLDNIIFIHVQFLFVIMSRFRDRVLCLCIVPMKVNFIIYLLFLVQ